MKIDFLCFDGSPLGCSLKDLWGEGRRGIGTGGSEYLMLTLCEEWHKAHHEVVLYNNPLMTDGSPFEQRSIGSFDPNADRDVLIVFRTPNPYSLVAKGLKVWLSCDQATIGDFRSFAGTVHKIVCISPRHAEYFAQNYGITNTNVIDIPVRMHDFDTIGEADKVENRLIFTSVPARGLDELFKVYPIIQQAIPKVSLAITSDYRLWGCGAGNEMFRNRWAGTSNVQFFGALPREKYIIELLKADILLYPSVYDELFCVSVAESQYAGAYPITSSSGALPTTNMGMVLAETPPHRIYADRTIELLRNRDELKRLQDEVKQKALERFSPERILKQWDELIFKGG